MWSVLIIFAPWWPAAAASARGGRFCHADPVSILAPSRPRRARSARRWCHAAHPTRRPSCPRHGRVGGDGAAAIAADGLAAHRAPAMTAALAGDARGRRATDPSARAAPRRAAARAPPAAATARRPPRAWRRPGRDARRRPDAAAPRRRQPRRHHRRGRRDTDRRARAATACRRGLGARSGCSGGRASAAGLRRRQRGRSTQAASVAGGGLAAGRDLLAGRA